jgi:hypothetical protein
MSNQPFQLGVNYPWVRYAQDFGRNPSGHQGMSLPENHTLLADEFARIRDCGLQVVRWFLFGDGRGGFISENDIPQRPDALLFADIDAVLHVAEQSGLQLCFSLIDYFWLLDRIGQVTPHPNSRVLQFAAGREAFLHRVLIPMFQRFQSHPALFGWEIANEPEWAIREFDPAPAARMRYADFRAFAAEVAAAVHEFAHAPVTLGSARLDWLRAWSEIDLDFYQGHFYPPRSNDPNATLARLLHSLRALDKPLWVGELPARDATLPGYKIQSALDECREAGALGAAVWRWTTPEANGTDVNFGCVDPQILMAWNTSSRARSAVV